MPSGRSLPGTLLLACALTFAAGCDELGPPMPEPGPEGALVDAEGRPVDFAKLSTHEEAQYADLTVDAAGTLHAVYQDKNKRHARKQIYHRASADGGATWSEEVNLLEDDEESQAGFVRVAADGAGRVYAFWKTFKGFDTTDPSGGDAGTLAYRVLSGGQWSAAVTLGTPGQVVSWFPTTGPDGSLHMVWSETLEREAGYYSPYWQAGRIRRAALAGAAPGAPEDVFLAAEQRVGDSPVVNYDGYKGLDGYLDADGTLHFTALKIATKPEVGAPSALTDVVLFEGDRETPLLKVARLEATLKGQHHHPPMLLPDAEGRAHLLVLDQGRQPPALLDYALPDTQAPTVVYELPDAKGDLKTFRAQRGPGGRMAVFWSAQPEVGVKHDMFAAVYDGARWGAPVNLTQNKAREDFASYDTSDTGNVSKHVVYSAQTGTGAFDGEGRLNMLLVNKEIVSIMNTSGSPSGTSGFVGTNSTSHVYFHRL